MKRLSLFSILAYLFAMVPVLSASGGFDEFGYNYKARIFVGKADGVDRLFDGKVWGDPTYANDMLVMKWSKAWDNARFHGEPWTADAWVNNEWNGKVPNGSGEVWHYKIIWVGPELEKSPYWREGGYPIWGQFEVIMDHGTLPEGGHEWFAKALPCGYGAKQSPPCLEKSSTKKATVSWARLKIE